MRTKSYHRVLLVIGAALALGVLLVGGCANVDKGSRARGNETDRQSEAYRQKQAEANYNYMRNYRPPGSSGASQ